MENKNTNNQVTDYYYLSTLQTNKSYFHKRETEGADTAIQQQQLVVWTPTQALKYTIKKVNYPITINNINQAESIDGPQIHIIKG